MSAREMIEDVEPECGLRIPPHSRDAEQWVLGGLMLGFEGLADLGLAEVHFYTHQHRRIFSAIQSLHAVSLPVDMLTVADTMQEHGDLPYLNALCSSACSSAGVPGWAAIVKRKAEHRAIIAAADLAGLAAWKSENSASTLEQIAGIFAPLQRGQLAKAPRKISDIAIERTEYYQSIEDGSQVPGWPTGIRPLDSMLNGGLRPGGLYILAARPSVGKSSFAQHIASKMARDGRTALFLSMEMSDSEVADRAVSSAGRLDYSDLLSGRMDGGQWARAVDAMQQLSETALYVDDQPALTIADIRAKARSVPNLRVLVVDYLQLCSSSLRGENRNAQIEEISRGLKALAKDLDIAIMALSQLNRKVEERSTKRPNLGDLRDSGAVEQDADVVIFLWPAREIEGGSHLRGCLIEKNRQGRTGEFPLQFWGSTQEWQESSQPLELAKQGGARKGFE
jgi:replicative DNA helicase